MFYLFKNKINTIVCKVTATYADRSVWRKIFTTMRFYHFKDRWKLRKIEQEAPVWQVAFQSRHNFVSATSGRSGPHLQAFTITEERHVVINKNLFTVSKDLLYLNLYYPRSTWHVVTNKDLFPVSKHLLYSSFCYSRSFWWQQRTRLSGQIRLFTINEIFYKGGCTERRPRYDFFYASLWIISQLFW